MIPKIRLITQIVIFLGIILVTYLNHYENQKVKYGGQAIIEKSAVLRVIDQSIGLSENRTEIATFLQGDVWAAQIGKLKLTDPLAFLGNLSRTKNFYGILFLAALIPIIATLLLGKVFCSWICPMGLLFEGNDQLRNFLKKKGVPLFDVKAPHWLKYAVLGLGITTGLLFGVHYFLIIYPPKLVSGEIYFWVTRASFSFGLLFIFTILAVELIAAPRIWCRSLCPGGAVYTILSKFRVLRIKNDLKNCIDCGICDKVCPYEITPSKGHLSADCDHCSLCIPKCPVNTLSFIVGPDREVRPAAPRKKLKVAQHAAMLVFIFTLFFAADTSAHHIRGLPHYGYSENYPQIPTYEEQRVVDDWQINFSYIRIFETKHCDLAVYLKNTKTGKPFNGVLTFQVFGQWENPKDTHPFDALLDPTNTFRVGWVYEDDGIYTTRIKFNDGTKEYVEDFRMQIGKVGFNMLWLILPGAVILILVILNLTKRKKVPA